MDFQSAGDTDEKRSHDKRQRAITPGVNTHGLGQCRLPVYGVQGQPYPRVFDAIEDKQAQHHDGQGEIKVWDRVQEIDAENDRRLNASQAAGAAKHTDEFHPGQANRFTRGERADQEIKLRHPQ